MLVGREAPCLGDGGRIPSREASKEASMAGFTQRFRERRAERRARRDRRRQERAADPRTRVKDAHFDVETKAIEQGPGSGTEV